MKRINAILVLLAGLAIVGSVSPLAMADEWNQKTIFTFSGPVEIPGQVLPAGTYVFKLANSDSDRNIVQVFNKEENHLYGTFLAIPDYRMRPADKPIITFDERPGDSAEAVRGWFYPGENFGHEFVYPKPKAMALAKANRVAVPSMPAELAANTTKPAATIEEPHIRAMRQAPLMAQKPTQEEVAIADVFASAAAPTEPPPTDASAASNALPQTLPATGSSLPLIGLIGLLSLTAAVGCWFAIARMR